MALTVALVEEAIESLLNGDAESVTLPTGVSYRVSSLDALRALRRELMMEQGTGGADQPRRCARPMKARR